MQDLGRSGDDAGILTKDMQVEDSFSPGRGDNDGNNVDSEIECVGEYDVTIDNAEGLFGADNVIQLL